MKFVGWTRSARVTTTCPPFVSSTRGPWDGADTKTRYPYFSYITCFAICLAISWNIFVWNETPPWVCVFDSKPRHNPSVHGPLQPDALLFSHVIPWMAAAHTVIHPQDKKCAIVTELFFFFKRYVLPLCSTFEKTIWRPHPHLKS